MSRDYAESRIREALRLARGNPTRARAQVIAWAAQDQRLLMGLAQPHLTGIVAHAVNRVIYRQGADVTDEPIPATPRSLDLPPDTFGKQILSALSDQGAPVFGLESGTRAQQAGPKKASQAHIDAIKKLASKSSHQPNTDKK